jgi:trk system potassium uptake protein TrkH
VPRFDRGVVAALVHDVALMMVPLGVIALPTAAIALFFEEYVAAVGLLGPILIAVIALLVIAWTRRHRGEERPSPTAIATIGWFLAAVVCAMPFLIAAAWTENATPTLGKFADPINAFFESMSGLTSTGLTITIEPRDLPMSLLWWRSTMQWLGGVGILFIVLAVTVNSQESLDPGQDDSSDDEANADEETDDDRQIGPVIRRTWLVYGLLTVASFIGMWILGMPLWDAANHAQTAISTAGFSINSNSLTGYSRPVQAVAIATMIAGGLSFFTLRHVLLRGKVPILLRDPQAWLLFGIIGIGTLALWPLTWMNGFDTLFQIVTTVCTAGFSTVLLADLGSGTLVLLTILMLVGASAGSTCGGIKLARVRHFVVGLFGRSCTDPALVEPLRRTRIVILSFVLTFAAGVAILTLAADVAPLAACFEAASALGTVGLSVGVTHPDASATTRLTLIALMWLGRLETILFVSAILSLWTKSR